MADRMTDERLHQLVTDDIVCVQDWVRSMAAELLASRARITALEADLAQARLDTMPASIDHDQAGAEEFAEPEPLGYLPAVTYSGGARRRLAPSEHLPVSDQAVPGGVVAWAYGPPEAPGKLIGHAVFVSDGEGWFADTVNLDGSPAAADSRCHDWLTDSGYQAMVVELREVGR
ncbi:hypothetical protein ACTWPB_07520 [Nocardia sp. IBHARD005]|uniref:hypothetical protein n=1 Tax=Nocardia sp. IBHARD005 TaxID=3457765 RepID=UPI004058EAC3